MKKCIYVLILLITLISCSSQEALEETKEPVKEADTGDIAVNANETTEVLEEVKSPVVDVEEDVEVENEKPLYRINENNWTVEPIQDENTKVVLLTFDDAPDKNALAIAKTLHEFEVKAIFFVNGHFLDTEEEANVLREIHQLGFPIGNHTFSHSRLKDLTKEEQYREIVALNDRVEEIIGERPKFFRAPYGLNTDESKEIAAQEKMLIMNWTYGYDWEKEYQNKETLADIMVNSPYLVNGANLLMHDRAWTSEALPEIIKGLQAKGFEIVDPMSIEVLK